MDTIYHVCIKHGSMMQSKVLKDSDPIPDFQLSSKLHKEALNLYLPGENSAHRILENFIEDIINIDDKFIDFEINKFINILLNEYYKNKVKGIMV